MCCREPRRAPHTIRRSSAGARTCPGTTSEARPRPLAPRLAARGGALPTGAGRNAANPWCTDRTFVWELEPRLLRRQRHEHRALGREDPLRRAEGARVAARRRAPRSREPIAGPEGSPGNGLGRQVAAVCSHRGRGREAELPVRCPPGRRRANADQGRASLRRAGARRGPSSDAPRRRSPGAVDLGSDVRAGQHQDARRWTVLADAPRRLDAVDERHADVHQRHIRGERRREVDGLEPVLRSADDRNPLVEREQGFHHLDEQGSSSTIRTRTGSSLRWVAASMVTLTPEWIRSRLERVFRSYSLLETTAWPGGFAGEGPREL